ncbi:MAG: hypothetical protein Q9165_007755 [Trypethelium subeluteriae]
MGSHRRRSTSGTIPISPPFGSDTENLADSNDLAVPQSFVGPGTSKSVERQTNVSYDFAFSLPSTPLTDFTVNKQDSPPLKTPTSHSARSQTPKPETLIPASQAQAVAQVPVPNPGKGPPKSNPNSKNVHSPFRPSPLSEYLLSPTPKPFSPLTPGEIALVSKGAAKWGDSLSGSTHHRLKHPLRLPRSRTASSSAPPVSHGAGVAESTSASRKKPGPAGLLGALGMVKGKGVGIGAMASVHHAHSISAPLLGKERVGGEGDGDGKAQWVPRPALRRYPTVVSRSEGPRDLEGVLGTVERGGVRGGAGVGAAAGIRGGAAVGADSPALLNPGGRGRNEEVAHGKATGPVSGPKQTRKEKRDEKRKQELKSSIRVVGSETWI